MLQILTKNFWRLRKPRWSGHTKSCLKGIGEWGVGSRVWGEGSAGAAEWGAGRNNS